MLITIILGIVAGFVAPYAEPHVKRGLERVLLADAPMTAVELRLFSFAICLFGASGLADLLGEGSGVALALGAVLGVFGPRMLEKYRSK